MALNAFLHPRNPYKTRPDFKLLAAEFPQFAEILPENGKLDFEDQNSVKILTLCLLKKDFDLDLEIPPGNLVPTLPLRFNYLLWIEDLLNEVTGTSGSRLTVKCI